MIGGALRGPGPEGAPRGGGGRGPRLPAGGGGGERSAGRGGGCRQQMVAAAPAAPGLRPLPSPPRAPERGPGGAVGPALPLALGARRGEPWEAQRAPGRPAGVWVPAARSGPAAGARSETGRSQHVWDARGWDRASGCPSLGW